MEKYDLAIIGSGPAGLNAAVYAARYKLNTILLGQLPGGMAAEAHEICNLITYKKIKGFEFAIKAKEQVEELGIKYVPTKVSKINKNKNEFLIETESGEFISKKIIIATGNEKRKLDIENEMQFIGKGISYCATCDGAFFKDKIVGVVGGSDAALTAALLLAEFATKVYIIYRKDHFFRAEPAWIEQVEKNNKIESIFNSNITKLNGKNFLESVELDNKKELKLDGLFVEIGSTPQTKLASDIKVELENGFIKTDKKQKTNIKGVYAAGDVTNNNLKQIITAASEGAIAATQIFEELKSE